ncbi:MAG: hypothetical protein JXQ71_11495 [Verrucomicrobia bacterium]|nr:hypothetical protein [Verrucomicrobiota bacterium]
MNAHSESARSLTRRGFIRTSALVAASGVAAMPGAAAPAASDVGGEVPGAGPGVLPCGRIGKARISRVLLGGNLISGYLHARDLKYAGALFRAYVTEEKLMQTLRLAEECGVNTVFETGAEYVRRYNRRFGGRMQFIPHIKVEAGQGDAALRDHIRQQADTGAVALYVWGVSGDRLVQGGAVERLRRAVELAKDTGLPVGVGGHSLRVPMACEKAQVPCDFYVKTFHSDDYPSATPKALRKEFIWLDGGEGWYDNMWCIDPEETVAFMRTVTKPWIAFKVLAAGAIYPRQAFPHAFKSGADFIAVGMFDFQIKENCELAGKVLRLGEPRDRPWCA